MKTALALVVCFLSVASGLMIPDSLEHQVVLDTSHRTSVCPDAPASKLYRLFHPDKESYLYTTSLGTSDSDIPSGFEYEIVAAHVYKHPQPSTVPFYHLLNTRTANSFYTRDPRERDAVLAKDADYTSHGVCAHVFPRRLCGSKPFFRLHNPDTGNYFYTTDQKEVDRMVLDEGYADPVIAGFVML
ncbi:hypothetical protein MKEN_01456400 [Mycena kentingensis (nom. inval.)]|nr:hypothetical protein MKEN_01456400 [Mycena kentingensis (nom. inval.)]